MKKEREEWKERERERERESRERTWQKERERRERETGREREGARGPRRRGASSWRRRRSEPLHPRLPPALRPTSTRHTLASALGFKRAARVGTATNTAAPPAQLSNTITIPDDVRRVDPGAVGRLRVPESPDACAPLRSDASAARAAVCARRTRAERTEGARDEEGPAQRVLLRVGSLSQHVSLPHAPPTSALPRGPHGQTPARKHGCAVAIPGSTASINGGRPPRLAEAKRKS
eukprot:3495417-Rhodomonas_salina.1